MSRPPNLARARRPDLSGRSGAPGGRSAGRDGPVELFGRDGPVGGPAVSPPNGRRAGPGREGTRVPVRVLSGRSGGPPSRDGPVPAAVSTSPAVRPGPGSVRSRAPAGDLSGRSDGRARPSRVGPPDRARPPDPAGSVLARRSGLGRSDLFAAPSRPCWVPAGSVLDGPEGMVSACPCTPARAATTSKFRHVQTCLVKLRHARTCPYMLEHAQTGTSTRWAGWPGDFSPGDFSARRFF